MSLLFSLAHNLLKKPQGIKSGANTRIYVLKPMKKRWVEEAMFTY
jgi:hypothetical protein